MEIWWQTELPPCEIYFVGYSTAELPSHYWRKLIKIEGFVSLISGSYSLRKGVSPH